MSRVGYLLKDSELLILFAENNQILLKISVIPILINFHLSGSTLSVSNQPTQLIIAAHNCHISSIHHYKVITSSNLTLFPTGEG